MEGCLEQIVRVSGNLTSAPATLYIPKKVREALGIHKGDYVVLRVEGGRLIVEPLKSKTLGGRRS